MDAIVAFFGKAGPIGAAILAGSVVALAIVLERLWVFRRMGRLAPELLARVRQSAARGAADEAASLVGGNSHPVAACLRHVLERAEGCRPRTRAELERALAHVASGEVRRLERFLPTLSLIAHVAPLLGLLGTVAGMIEAFQAIEGLGGRVNASVLAGGIWEALLTTALGLGVAIPATVAHSAFQGRVHGLVADLKDEAGALLDLLEDTGRIGPGHTHPEMGREARTA